jgi:hypothetical protein
MRLTLLLIAAAIAGCGEPARVRECFDLAKEKVKDQDSATIVETDLRDPKVTAIVVRASNGFGGFERVWLTCKGGAVTLHADRSSWLLAM